MTAPEQPANRLDEELDDALFRQKAAIKGVNDALHELVVADRKLAAARAKWKAAHGRV